MNQTKDLMLAKLGETGDRAEAVKCLYHSADGRKHQCNVVELPAGELDSFSARSENHVYFQTKGDRIEAWNMLLLHSLS